MQYHKSPFGENNVEWCLHKINNIEFQTREIFKMNGKPKITIKTNKLILKAHICLLCDKKIWKRC